MVEQVLQERYAIQKQLGQNGGRQTLLARDLQTQDLVAIKLLTFGVDFQWDDLKLFEREAETLQSLSHPAIPRYLDHFHFQTSKTKGLALVQSYIEAKSLAKWVKFGRRFNEKEIQQLAKALLEILMYLHDEQHPPVIHRDIKPSNILLTNRSGNSVGQVYLVDFGSVQTLAAREGSTITVVGTYGYMPPEQFGGRAVPASDLYSLGATLIYLVTGMHPADLPQEDLQIEFEPKIHLDSAFVDWLYWMTKPELKRRFTSAFQALKELEKSREIEDNNFLLNKPFYSKVQIKKKRNNLDISIHSTCYKGNFFQVSIQLFYQLLWTSWLTFTGWGIIIKFVDISSIFLLNFGFCIPLVYVNLIVFMFLIQSTRLQINQEKIYLTYEWFGGVRYQVQSSSSRESICKLGMLLHYDRSSHPRRNIQIWAGTRQYKLPTEHLTDKEIDWIAYELSEWLKLPITK